ncbi:gntP permease family protein [Candidatus Erwinia dacicola]|uniref:GntP permease family protein n=1 Tax=Candidatus Erwinia dacicola TaxID=252393 RepID=A0A328TNT5_9GAMM|nr:gntP permease family protein [Candidatus Erwinia dacicola]
MGSGAGNALTGTVRIIQGSVTMACLTAVGLIMPVIEPLHYTGAQLATLSICIAGGRLSVATLMMPVSGCLAALPVPPKHRR